MTFCSFSKISFFLFLILIGCISCKESSHPSGVTSQEANSQIEVANQSIIGGKIDLRYPAVGALTENNFAFCTGTLISSRVVLTAGHCVDGKSKKALSFRVDLPSSSSSNGFTSYQFPVDNRYIAAHPKWTGSLSGGHDIAIVVLKKPIDPKIAKPIAYNATPLVQGWVSQKALFLGFGLIQSVPKAVSPATKHGAMIPIVRMLSDRFLTYDPKVSTCHGDSGGPALVTIAGRLVVIGVNSYSSSAIVPGSNPPRTRCDGRNGVTRVDVYAPFVQSWLDRFGDAPRLCKVSLDCTHCEDCSSNSGKQICARKASLKQTTYCRPCSNDQMCGGGSCYRFGSLFRCLHRCPANGCCGEGASCKLWTVNAKEDWYCIPNKQKCPDVACLSDQDCGKGEVCKAKICVANRPPRSAKLCFPCTKHSDCSSGKNGSQALCLGAKGYGFCTQPCNRSGFCPDGFSCQQPYRGMAKQCLPTNGSCVQSCQKDDDCFTGFVCQTGSCVRKGGGVGGDFCEPAPCKKGLSCIATLYGKRCLQTCGTPSGEAGSRCLSGNKCSGTARCNLLSAKLKVCTQPCTSDSQCHGGVCLNRVCSCSKDSDCDQDAFCNQTTGFFSACLPKKISRPCQKRESCKELNTQAYCVPKSEGSIGFGQPCDNFQRCRKGLACIKGKVGWRCLEDCTKTRSCTLGGVCSAERKGVAVCVCSGNDCPSGRSCSAPFYLGQFGYCVSSSTTPACSNSFECPPDYVCNAGQCVSAPPPEPMPEPVLELMSEPVLEPMPEPVLELMPEPVLEPTPEPDVVEKQAPDEPNKIADAGESDRSGSEQENPKDKVVETKAPKSGCGCEMSSVSIPTAVFPFFLLLLFFLGIRSKHSKTKK